MTEWVVDLNREARLIDALGSRDMLILLAIRRAAPTVRELAQQLPLSERSVHSHLATLERLGLVRDDRGLPRAGERYNVRRPALACTRVRLHLSLGPHAEPGVRHIDLSETPEVMDALTERRVRVLRAIGSGARTPRELTLGLALSAPALQGHLRALEALGLIGDSRRPERIGRSRRRLRLTCRELVLGLDLS